MESCFTLYSLLLLLHRSKCCPLTRESNSYFLNGQLMNPDYMYEQYFIAQQLFSQNVLTFIPVSPLSKLLSVESAPRTSTLNK